MFTVKPYGSDGAFLIVLASPPDATLAPTARSDTPDAPVVTAYFKTGQTCRLGSPCPPVGIEYATPTNPPATQLNSPVKVSYRSRGAGPTSPLLASHGAGVVGLPTARQRPGARQADDHLSRPDRDRQPQQLLRLPDHATRRQWLLRRAIPRR